MMKKELSCPVGSMVKLYIITKTLSGLYDYMYQKL